MNRNYTEDPKISVIIPVFNVEKYVSFCIESVLQQTFQDFELILVDDGSIDSSGEICDKYAQIDKRINVIHQENKGQAAARNIGLKNARGQWIHFVDSDDMIHMQMLEILYNSAIKNKCDISMCDSLACEKCPKDFWNPCESKEIVLDINEDVLINLSESKGNYYWSVCAKLLKKDILERYSFTEGRIFEDNAVVFKWFFSVHKIIKCDNVLYFYRLENSSTMRKNYSQKKLDYMWALEEQLNFYKRKNYVKMYNTILNRYVDAGSSFYRNKEFSRKTEVQQIIRKLYIRVLVLSGEYIKLDITRKKEVFSIIFPRLYKLIKVLSGGDKGEKS